MTRYIDADALEKAIADLPYGYRGMVRGIIAEQPTADVRENRKGKWIYCDDESISYRCSECGKHQYGSFSEIFSGEFRFCPNCGAEMRGDTDA